MDDFIAILSLLIITGLFTVGFAFSVLFRSSPNADKEQRIVVADMIESLRKICPVGARKGWTLIPMDYSSPRNWKRQHHSPVSKKKIMLHGSSVIVKSPASIVKDLITKPLHWDEWDSCYFISSMTLSENDCLELRGDKYMKCILVSKDKKPRSQNKALMYCFMNLSSDNVRWILFWNISCLDWWFFLIQPAMRKSDANHCLLTIIRGTDSITYEAELAKTVWLRIKNIKDAAELHSFKVFTFNPVFEHSFSPHVDRDESIKQHKSCKKRSLSESYNKELYIEEETLPKDPPDVLLQLVSSSGFDPTSADSSRKFNIRLINVQSTHGNQDPHHRETRHKTGQEHSLNAVLNEAVSSTCDSKKILQQINSEPQIVSTTSGIKNNSLISHERSSSVSVERANSPVSRNESNIPSSQNKNLDSQNVFLKPKDSDSGTGTKRKQSFVQFKRKFSGISSINSNQKSVADISETLLTESESHIGMLEEKSVELSSDSRKTLSAAIKRSADEAHLESGEFRGSRSDLNINAANSERARANFNHSALTSDKSSVCEGNCSPICDVCLKVAYQELSDFEVLLPHLDISEERITDLVTKGNYCAAELQAEVHEASQVKTSVNLERKHSGGRWTCLSSNKDIDLFLKTKEEGSLKISSYLCQTSFAISANRAWDVIRNPRLRFICDNTSKKVTVLEELPEQQKIIYTYHEFGGLLKKEAMDFCLLHSERVEHSKYSLAYLSIEYENCPLSSAVRGMLFPSGWVIEKLQGNSDECKISYLIQVVVNRPDSLLVQESSNIVLHSLQNLRNYFTSAPENIR